MSNAAFVITAYVLTWVPVGLYALSILRRHRALEREVRESNE